MFERRLRLFLLIVFVGGLLLACRAAQVQVFDHEDWTALATANAERVAYLPARRGELLDVKGRVLARDVAAFEASVNFRALPPTPDARWLRQESGRRARLLPEWPQADDTGRDELIAQEMQGVLNDLDAMWNLLAEVSHKTRAEIDAIRAEVVREVEAKHSEYWRHLYDAAKREFDAAPRAPWYERLVAGQRQPPTPEAYQKRTIGEQLSFHAILPDIDQATYNRLALAQERFPQYRADSGLSTSVLRLWPAQRREYPYADVGCHVIGRLGSVYKEDREQDPNKGDQGRRYALVDRIGREGLESLAERALRGIRGQRLTDRRGQHLRTIEATPGESVRTSLDIELQADIQQAFKAVDFQHPDWMPDKVHHVVEKLSMNGAAVVIDVPTGQVRALVSVPTYDLNQFEQLYPQLVADDLNRPLANRALIDKAEPGSAVKPMIGLAAVTQRLIGATDTIECTGYPVIDGRRYDRPRCWTMSMFGARGLGAHHVVPSAMPHPTGHLTLADAIERSCNVYFITEGDKLGIEGINYWFRRFGFGRPTGIGLPETAGILPTLARIPADERASAAWYASIGQGRVNATPIQVANEFATIARDGRWKRPRLLQHESEAARPAPVLLEDGSPVPDEYDLKLDPAALRAVRTGMYNVVESNGGTGTQVRRRDVKVAAKTGSATATQLSVVRRDEDGNEIRDADGNRVVDYIEYGTYERPNPQVKWYRMTGLDEKNRPKGTHSWVAGYAPAHNPQVAFAVYVEYGGSGGIGAGSVVNKLLDACIEHGYVTPDATNATPAARPPQPPELLRPIDAVAPEN